MKAKDMLEIAAHDIGEIDLTDYNALIQINNIANQLIRASQQLGRELFGEENN